MTRLEVSISERTFRLSIVETERGKVEMYWTCAEKR